MRRLLQAHNRLGISLVAVALLSPSGCSDDARRQGSAYGADAGAATTSDARTGHAGTQLGSDGAVLVVPSGADSGRGCNQVELNFESRPATVFILVDRSSSMFENARWQPLKTGVLQMVERLQSGVRFGFSSYTGQNGGLCPDLTMTTPLALDNYARIESAYDAVVPPAYKGETPTARAIDAATALLTADTEPGSKFILLVTDGEPDFCDDGNVTCARDAVIGAVQAAHAAGVGTFIFAIGEEVEQTHLQDVANAGTGQSVEDHQRAVAQQCSGTKGAYTTPAGSAPFFQPNVNDRELLVSALAGVVTSARSCQFDLQGKIMIDLSEADSGLVQIDDVRVPYGGPDGYRMNSATQLELLGASCERLKQEDVQRVSIDFPCQAVIAI